MAQVQHSAVCQIYDISESTVTPYIAMRWIEGESLSSFVARLQSDQLQVKLELLVKVAAGVEAIHRQGLLAS